MTRPEETVRSTIQKRDDKGVIRNGAEWLALWADPDSMKSSEEREADRQTARARAAAEKYLAATARALSGDADLTVTFVADESRVRSGFTLRRLPRALDDKALAAARGEADSKALLLRYHDRQTHREQAPAETDQARLYDMCEQVRCEAVGALAYAGVEQNLIARQIDRLKRLDLLNAHLASLIPLEEGLQMVLRDALIGRDDASIGTSGFWMWDRWLRDRFSTEFEALAAAQIDQRAFGRLSATLIEKILETIGKRRPRDRTGGAATASWQADELDDEPRLKEESPEGEVFQPGGTLFLERDPHPGLESVTQAQIAPSRYQVFTRAHDLMARADSLSTEGELKSVREMLDTKRSAFRRELSKLTARLQRRLMARQARAWSFNQEEGLIDVARLDRVIVNPEFANAYKQEEDTDFPNSVVTILIDNSGSMRGKPIEIACIATDLISSALDNCGITNEILGFTTRRWKGGQSRREWNQAGKPDRPGRLNDLLHVIYKSADEPYRRARTNLCAMVSNDLLKENIDGEALLWAANRLLARPEERKILIAISDGAPMDQATVEVNDDKGILDRHLAEAVKQIQRTTPIELAAIGIKHEVDRHYPRAIRIDSIDDLGNSLVGLLDKLLD